MRRDFTLAYGCKTDEDRTLLRSARYSPTDLVSKPAASNNMDAQDGQAPTRQFTVSLGDGYGTTICTFETLPLVPLKCTGIRKGSRDTIPLGYTFSWAWKNKNALVKGGVSKHPSEGTALVQMDCINLVGDSLTRDSASGSNPNSVLMDGPGGEDAGSGLVYREKDKNQCMEGDRFGPNFNLHRVHQKRS